MYKRRCFLDVTQTNFWRLKTFLDVIWSLHSKRLGHFKTFFNISKCFKMFRDGIQNVWKHSKSLAEINYSKRWCCFHPKSFKMDSLVWDAFRRLKITAFFSTWNRLIYAMMDPHVTHSDLLSPSVKSPPQCPHPDLVTSAIKYNSSRGPIHL